MTLISLLSADLCVPYPLCVVFCLLMVSLPFVSIAVYKSTKPMHDETPIQDQAVTYALAIMGIIIERKGRVPAECWKRAFESYKTVVRKIKEVESTLL